MFNARVWARDHILAVQNSRGRYHCYLQSYIPESLSYRLSTTPCMHSMRLAFREYSLDNRLTTHRALPIELRQARRTDTYVSAGEEEQPRRVLPAHETPRVIVCRGSSSVTVHVAVAKSSSSTTTTSNSSNSTSTDGGS